MSEIIPRLFLTGCLAVADIQLVQETVGNNNITIIRLMACDRGQHHLEECISWIEEPIIDKNIEHHWFRVHDYDTKSNNILSTLEEASEVAINAWKNNRIVIIHCRKGISRSATLVVSFLLHLLDYDLDIFTAIRKNLHEEFSDPAYLMLIDFIKEKRSVVNPNTNFRCLLRQLENKIRVEMGFDVI